LNIRRFIFGTIVRCQLGNVWYFIDFIFRLKEANTEEAMEATDQVASEGMAAMAVADMDKAVKQHPKDDQERL